MEQIINYIMSDQDIADYEYWLDVINPITEAQEAEYETE